MNIKDREKMDAARAALQALVNDINAMRYGGEEVESSHWFGPFPMWDAGESGSVIQWPNVGLSTQTAEDALQKLNNPQPTEAITDEVARDALVIWEIAQDDSHIREWLENGEGVAQGRDNALKLAPYIGAAWQACEALGYSDQFDWDFVPDILQWLVTNKQPCQPSIEAIREAQKSVYLEWARANER